ncbi:MAG TPA: metalloregulator ArsR/SmtB family transcription factor [Acidiferrobacter sp.]|nr:metalloregulator ArsR/SmtB family transcription factor [Acidiferrobacter sp.]
MVTEDDVFAVLGNPIRRRLLVLLLTFGELCVCELFYAVDLPQTTVSRHLAVAREAQLVETRRQGTWMYYRLHRDLPPWVSRVIAALKLAPSQHTFSADEHRLAAMPNRPIRDDEPRGPSCCG